MNLFKFFTLVIMLSAFAACGDDDDSDQCIQADWVGTYSGTVVCTEDGVASDAEDVSLTITASGTDRLIITYVTSGLTNEIDPLLFDNCNLTFSISGSGATQRFSADLDGDNLSYTEDFSSDSNTLVCQYTVTRI